MDPAQNHLTICISSIFSKVCRPIGSLPKTGPPAPVLGLHPHFCLQESPVGSDMGFNQRRFFDKLAELMQGKNTLIGNYSLKSNALVALTQPFGESREAKDIEPWLIETAQENLRGLQAEYSLRACMIDKTRKQLEEIRKWMLRAQEWSNPRLESALAEEITDLQRGIDIHSKIGTRAIYKSAPTWQTLGIISALLKQDGVPRSAFWAVGVMLYSGVDSAVLGIFEDYDLVTIYEEQGDLLNRIEKRSTQSIRRSIEYQDRFIETDLADLGKDHPLFEFAMRNNKPPDDFMASLKKKRTEDTPE